MFELIVTTRFLHIIIAATLLLSTSGVTVTAYFCGDHLSGLSLLSPTDCSSELKACCKLAEGKKKCCTSESEFVQIDIDQVSYAGAEFTDLDLLIADILHASSTSDLPISSKVLADVYYRPPPLIKNHTILFQNFRC